MKHRRPRFAAVAALLAAMLLVAGSVAACGGDDDDDEQGGGARAGTQTRESEGAGRCEEVAEPRPRRVRTRRAPTFELERDKEYVAEVVTSCGAFEIELDARQAPRTGGSFVSLARDGFYDGLAFHRVVTGFVIQGGDPKGDGSGGPGYSIRERPPDDVVYSEGVAAMAKTEVEPPGTSGSQFFVVTSDDAALDPIYALLGRVTEGLEVVRRIELTPAGPDEAPVRPVVIERIRVRAR